MRVCPECSLKTAEPVCPKDGRPTIDEARLSMKRRDPNVGLVIEGKFDVDKRLGKGGMGAVYRARHVTTGGYVAIKLMNPSMAEDTSAIKRFYIEAQNMHGLMHPNTVTVSDFGQTEDGTLYLVMQYVEGRSLGEVLKEEERLAPARAVHVVEQVLKSLGEAHDKGIVHRDMKPDNIMLLDQFGEKDFVKVLDFGISRSIDGTGASTKGAIGTPRYMAPEQWRGQRVDARTDLYSIGCILFRMLAGRSAYTSKGKGQEQVVSLMHGHLQEPVPRLSVVAPGAAPPELSELVARLMAKDPGERPVGAAEVVAALVDLRARGLLAAEMLPIVDEPPAVDVPQARAGSPPRSETLDTTTPFRGFPLQDDEEQGPSDASGTGLPAATAPDEVMWSKPKRTEPWRWMLGAAAVIFVGAGAAWVVALGGEGETTSTPPATGAGTIEPDSRDERAPAEALRTGVEEEQPEAARLPATAGIPTPAPAQPPPPVLPIQTKPAGAEVALRIAGGAWRILGETPLAWAISEAAAAALERNQTVELRLTHGEGGPETLHPLSAELLDSGEGLSVERPAPPPPAATGASTAPAKKPTAEPTRRRVRSPTAGPARKPKPKPTMRPQPEARPPVASPPPPSKPPGTPKKRSGTFTF